MGALHEGHFRLFRAAAQECPTAVASIFVNPTQFAAGEDFERYPRQEEVDFAAAESCGISIVFAPSRDEMYSGGQTSIAPGPAAKRWEGEARPGHFEGVATVVSKLFHIVEPDFAYFGLKDYQQCTVIAQMVDDLDFRTKLRLIETVRESDGLALSSRNAYLSKAERAVAPNLYKSLQNLRSEIHESTEPEEAYESAVLMERASLSSLGFEIDYLEWVDSRTLDPVRNRLEAGRLLIAARLGVTRLIDNIPVEPL